VIERRRLAASSGWTRERKKNRNKSVALLPSSSSRTHTHILEQQQTHTLSSNNPRARATSFSAIATHHTSRKAHQARKKKAEKERAVIAAALS
jgi:hypothetical protein